MSLLSKVWLILEVWQYAVKFRNFVVILPWSFHNKHQISHHLNTMRCRYNAVNFHPNPHKKNHPISGPLGRDMGCLFWVQTNFHIQPQSQQWYVQYCVILDCVITAFSCTRDWHQQEYWLSKKLHWKDIPTFYISYHLKKKKKKNYTKERVINSLWQISSKSTVVQVMAWCLQAPSHYLIQCLTDHEKIPQQYIQMHFQW